MWLIRKKQQSRTLPNSLKEQGLAELIVLWTVHKVCRRVFVGVMKYFGHILMGHEIFYKVFNGLQNIFLSSIFVILFFKLRRLEHKISKLAIEEI